MTADERPEHEERMRGLDDAAFRGLVVLQGVPAGTMAERSHV
jgi:hypothetical protein